MTRTDVMHSFPLHVADWVGSEAIQTMSAAGEHAYLRLCLNQWRNEADGLPIEPQKLRLFTKLTPKEWALAWVALEPYFPVSPDGRRRNPRTEKEYRFCLNLREERSRSGQAGNAKRWGNGSQTDRSAIASGSQTGRPSPSPSPSLNYETSGAVNRDSEKLLAISPPTPNSRTRKPDPRSMGAVAGDIMARLGGGAA